jgi:HK97 gp10 family phage protein
MPDFVLGHRELESLLRKLPEKVAKRVTVNGLKAGGRVLVKGMKARAPRRTGQLADSPTVSSAAKVTQGRSQASVAFKKPVSRRVHLTEFGTEHSRAEPFIRPTLEQDGREAIKVIGENMGKGVEREARKMAKR